MSRLTIWAIILLGCMNLSAAPVLAGNASGGATNSPAATLHSNAARRVQYDEPHFYWLPEKRAPRVHVDCLKKPTKEAQIACLQRSIEALGAELDRATTEFQEHQRRAHEPRLRPL